MARKKIRKNHIELTAKLPIDLSMSKAYVLVNTPFNENHWTRTFRTKNDQIVVARVTQPKYLSRAVDLVIESNEKIDSEEIIDRISYEIGLDEEMEVLRKIKDEDSIVSLAIDANPGMRIYANSDAIEAAVLTMISQNTSFFTYLEIVEDLLIKYGDKVPWDKKLRVFPSKEKIAEMSISDWESINLGYKAKYLGNLSDIELDKIETFSYYPILYRGIEELQKIKGIGPYTSRILIIYHSRRYDLAFMDTYVVEVLNHKYDIRNFNNYHEFDNWVNARWSKEPALILHTLLLDYLPSYLKSHKTFYSK